MKGRDQIRGREVCFAKEGGNATRRRGRTPDSGPTQSKCEAVGEAKGGARTLLEGLEERQLAEARVEVERARALLVERLRDQVDV